MNESLFGISLDILFLQNFRQTVFDDIRKSTRLDGYQVSQFESTARQDCAITCLRNPLCMSYNFCANKLCELNSEDILLMSNASKDDPICVYGGMKNESKPACIEENKAKFIQVVSEAVPGPNAQSISVLGKSNSKSRYQY